MKDLSQLKKGDRGRIVAIKSDSLNIYRKLLSLGFMIGNEVIILQTFPTYLIQIGFTQVALDKDICKLVEVIPLKS